MHVQIMQLHSVTFDTETTEVCKPFEIHICNGTAMLVRNSRQQQQHRVVQHILLGLFLSARISADFYLVALSRGRYKFWSA